MQPTRLLSDLFRSLSNHVDDHAIEILCDHFDIPNIDGKRWCAAIDISDIKKTEFNRGREQGREEGYDDGHNAGYDEGYKAGHEAGYAEGEAAANEE